MYNNFNKTCKVCEANFSSWSEYLQKTTYLGIVEGFDGYRLELRVCSCKNTLATEELSV